MSVIIVIFLTFVFVNTLLILAQKFRKVIGHMAQNKTSNLKFNWTFSKLSLLIYIYIYIYRLCAKDTCT